MINEELFKCNKPYQYVGGEYLSYNKSFDDAKVRFAFAFPDKYEIGISNLGLRVIYGLVNEHPDYMADRVYAPESDFKPEILYGLESGRPIKDFDAIGFSLQYEMAYPTVLKMLEMSEIPYRNADRGENDPIIIAGGPCAFNPLPMSDFIDIFSIGDGEDVNIEICDVLAKKELSREEKIKAISELEGCWSSKYSKTVNKRIAQLKYETALKAYPIPYSSSVQDRAVVEIRRGCGRMCRFCQPGHVTLPVRERPAEDIIKIAKELVKNTGYDEYSLLSLSSNDYANIKEVIKELAVDFDKKKVSVSLPSQRIDGFNLELAQLCQSVRKSTMTLAPEAGSQRLRNVIKKNISHDQIVDTALTLYQNGWSRIKFYFIAGLPTETLEDMDEMADLLAEIHNKMRYLKKLNGFKHSLDITCTLSIFVPKPFTPFQWCPQMNLDEVTQHIKYLKSKTDKIKGVKINYHEQFTSQVEAVLTRGDAKLCDYIEALYKKGCYLDAWGEFFDQDVWADTAKECGVDLAALAAREYARDEVLPWDFVNIGVDKEWFVKEYNAAMSFLAPHPNPLPQGAREQDKCVNHFYTQKSLEYSKDLRKNMTDAENILWYYLRNRQLDGMKFRRQEAMGKYIVDFVCYSSKLIIELDGSQYLSGEQKEYDEQRDNFLSDNGFSVIRILDNEVFKNIEGVLETILQFPRPLWERVRVRGQEDFVPQPTCQTQCVNCGVCKNLKVKKVMAPEYKAKLPTEKKVEDVQENQDNIPNPKYRVTITKYGHLRFFSHLDWQNTFHKAIARSELPVAYSQGFNPTMKISMGIALPLFMESDCELVDIELKEEMKIDELKLKLESVMPEGAKIIQIVKLPHGANSIDTTASWAEYRVKLYNYTLSKFENLMYNTDKVLSGDEILITKKNKKGLLKTTNIKSGVKSYRFEEDCLYIVLKTGQQSEIPTVRADDLMKLIDENEIFDVKRIKFFDQEMKEL